MQRLLRILTLALPAVATAAAVVLLFLFALRQLNLHPPERLTIAAGAPGSAYHATALAYRRELARDGIELEIIETAGSAANRAALQAEGGADIALVQGGIALGDGIEGLAAIHVEPLWIFARAGTSVDADPNGWDGLRVAAGAAGSGARLVADRLAAITGAGALEAEAAEAVGGADAAAALLDGAVDIALFVAPTTAPYLESLFRSQRVQFLTLAHAEAVALKLRGARRVRLPSGVLDYRRPFPEQPVALLALVTRLVARDSLHPALVNRLVHAVIATHGSSELLPADRQYPSARDLDLPANAYAEQLFRDGFSALEGLLPYWVVAQFNRILLLLLPALILLLPLLRLLPTLYQWIFRNRVYRHYGRVHEIDRTVARRGETMDSAEKNELLAELRHIETTLRRANLPNSYRKQAYTLLYHIDYVRQRLADLPD